MLQSFCIYQLHDRDYLLSSPLLDDDDDDIDVDIDENTVDAGDDISCSFESDDNSDDESISHGKCIDNDLTKPLLSKIVQ